ncbi:hypothetical protein Brsp07_04574 [Brucella sp. NBRC 14130]|uniref:hypothetical protein n=1 Tax=Brucella sp. NBRC 14130 TaxID=3075483 RepID=UPI00309AAEE7
MDRALSAAGLAATPANYIAVMTAEQPSLANATWRFMRAAVKWWIGETISVAAAGEFTAAFPNARPPVKARIRYPKKLPNKIADMMTAYLRSGRRGRNKALAADLLEAGTLTGLRPCEWAGATLRGTTLIVPNAKYRPGISGNGVQRELSLLKENLTTRQIATIKRVLSELNGTRWEVIGGNVRRAFNNAKKALLRARTITPKEARTRIYEARHQFAANAKRDLDYRGGEVAAAMGQRSAMTAKAAYGNRSRAGSRTPVKPSADSVKRVDGKSVGRLQRALARVTNFFAAKSVRGDVARSPNQSAATTVPKPTLTRPHKRE